MPDDAPDAMPASLYERPVLVVDPGTHTAFITKLDADREGRFLVTASYDKTVRVWDAATGKLRRTIRLPAGPGHVGKAYAAAISPDGTFVVVGGSTRQADDDPEEQIYVFELGTGRLARRIGGLPSSVLALALSPDGTRVAVALQDECGVRLLDLTEGKVVAADEDYVADSYGLAFDAAGRLATTSLDGWVRLYDRDLRLSCAVKAPEGRACYEVAFSPDGQRLAVGYANAATVDVLEVVDGTKLKHLFPADATGVGQGPLLRVAWSADGESLFAAGEWRLGASGTGSGAGRRAGGAGPRTDP
jgi:WD40 repeat protein